jgi:hypothetical protein
MDFSQVIAIILCLSSILSQVGAYQYKFVKNYDDELQIATAITSACEEMFIKKSIIFDVMIYGPYSEHMQLIANNVLKELGENASIIFQHNLNLYKLSVEVSQSALIIMQDHRRLDDFQQHSILKNGTSNDIKLLIFIDAITFSKPKISDKNPQMFEYFLINYPKYVDMFTLNRFRPSSCIRLYIARINRFTKSNMKWEI